MHFDAFAFALGQPLLSSRRLAANKLSPKLFSIDPLILAFGLIIRDQELCGWAADDLALKLRTGSGVWLRLA